ncbi:TRAP transporter small permease subunit [Pinisolibacter aquiterrae]|uniref:TRAP transporter small permease subunit n=1 Tax=Pinisolibacter aquiterrae TaxID=2815579 RepID=UPI001E5D4F12|nr:TRAP transporter small permease subunit [Pinisolibacter aquiterrae]MCC8234016.1 TRAP transporter small permease subunit [Pinisolibacter aquiterrae]
MNAFIAFSRAIDRSTTWLGRVAAWLIVLAVLISTINAVIRKVFDASSNTWLELQWVLFGAVFLLCASWTLQANEHIRIDIVNSNLSKKTRNMIEMIGHVFFLLPMVAVFLYTGLPFLMRSLPDAASVGDVLGNAFHQSPVTTLGQIFALGEQSSNAGGLPQWPAKFLIVLGFAVLLVQAISELIKRIAIMRGLIEDVHAVGGHHAAAEAEAARLLAEAEKLAADKAAGTR